MPKPFRKGKLGDSDFALRDQAILMRRLGGDSVKQLQEKFTASKATIDRALARARKANVIAVSREFILTDIVAPALITIKSAIESGDVDTAMKLVQMVGILAPPSHAVMESGGEVIEEFEAVRRRLITRTSRIADDPSLTDIIEVPYEAAESSPRDHLHAEREGREADGGGLPRLLPGLADDRGRDE